MAEFSVGQRISEEDHSGGQCEEWLGGHENEAGRLLG